MSEEPSLTVHDARGPVRAVALVLHGGRSKSRTRVRPFQLAVLRMHPFATALRATEGLVVAQLRYRVRGWNGAERSPVPDTAWALDRLSTRFPDVPIALVGHSMGGRTAMYVAGHDGVRAVVGLAPWIEAGDPVEPLAGRRLLIVHGDQDRMTSPGASAAYARRAEGIAETVGYVSVAGEKHAMLRRAGVWTQLTTGFVRGVLFGTDPAAFADAPIATVLSEALAGRRTNSAV